MASLRCVQNPITKGSLRLVVGSSVVAEQPKQSLARKIGRMLRSKESKVREEGMRTLMEEYDKGKIPEAQYLNLLGRSVDVVLRDSDFLVAIGEEILRGTREITRRHDERFE